MNKVCFIAFASFHLIFCLTYVNWKRFRYDTINKNNHSREMFMIFDAFLCLLCPIILVSLFQQITKKKMGKQITFYSWNKLVFFKKKEDLGEITNI